MARDSIMQCRPLGCLVNAVDVGLVLLQQCRIDDVLQAAGYGKTS